MEMITVAIMMLVIGLTWGVALSPYIIKWQVKRGKIPPFLKKLGLEQKSEP